MKKLIRLSKTYHTIIILTFFLPFFASNCGPSAAEQGAKRIADSIQMADSINMVKTRFINSSLEDKYEKEFSPIVSSNKINLLKDTSNNKQKLIKKETKTGSIARDYIGAVVFYLCADNHLNIRGFGAVVFRFDKYLKEAGLTNAYLLILLSSLLIVKRKWRFYKSILIIDIFGFTFLLFAEGDMWGYWVCTYSWIGLIILDYILVYKSKKLKTISNGT